MQIGRLTILVALLIINGHASSGWAEEHADGKKSKYDFLDKYEVVEREWVGPGDPKAAISVSAKPKWTIRLKPGETPLKLKDKGDGRHLIVSHGEGQTHVREIDAATGRTTLGPSALGHNIDAISAGVLSKNRRFVLAWQGGVAELPTPLADADPAKYFIGNLGATYVSVSPSETLYATGNSRGHVSIESVEHDGSGDSTAIDTLPVAKIAWFPGKKMLAVLSIAAFPEKERLGQELRRLEEAEEQFSEKYKRYYSYYWAKMYRRKTSIYVWDFARGEKKKILSSDPDSVNRNIATASIAVNPNGKILYLTDSGGEVAFLTYPRRAVLCVVQTAGGSYIEDLAVSPDGKLLGCAYRNGRIRILDGATGHILWDHKSNATEHIQSLTFTNNSKGLITWGSKSPACDANGIVHAWELLVESK